MSSKQFPVVSFLKKAINKYSLTHMIVEKEGTHVLCHELLMKTLETLCSKSKHMLHALHKEFLFPKMTLISPFSVITVFYLLTSP